MTRLLLHALLLLGVLGCLQTCVGPARADQADRATVAACGSTWLAPVIRAEARRQLLPVAVLAAVIWHESRCKVSARGKAGEIGLCQLMGVARNGRADAELLNPAINVRTGARWLAMMATWCGGLASGLGAYNRGKCGVTRYSRKVLRTMEGMR